MADHHLIKEINRSTDRWRLVVRVDRKWEIYPKSSPTELFAISMVLMDEEVCINIASIFVCHIFPPAVLY